MKYQTSDRLVSFARLWAWSSILSVLLVSFALVFSGQARAGYYATVTAMPVAPPSTSFYVGRVSGCFLTPTMAVGWLGGTTTYANFMIDSLSLDGTWSARGTWSGSVSGTYATCQAAAAVAGFPSMAGGVSDPAITGDSVLGGGSGGGGGSSGTGLSPAEYQQFTDLVTQANAPYDYAGGGMIFSAMLLSTLGLYLLVRGCMEFVAVARSARRLG